MFSIETFYQNYETESIEVVVNGKKFNILLPKYLYHFINPIDMLSDFPLWAKVWKASWVLAGYLAEMPVDTEKQFLEIGAGAGLVSIVAASFGHQITMTEYNPDALNFAHANAYINNCQALPVIKLDWHNPTLRGKFDYIVASEVVFKKEDFFPLRHLFNTYLQPQGEILLASEMRKASGDFYTYLASNFDIKIEKKILRSKDEKTHVLLFKISFPPH
jgi:2-polyprenyl-3-methyl-5-hydroxy-6-metoxy-1,4-benzoquinol methylase